MDKKGKKPGKPASPTKLDSDPDCPFREFKDTELGIDLWGVNPLKLKSSASISKYPEKKSVTDFAWIDDQTQPLPRSVRRDLDGWVRAEELAEIRWEVGVTVAEDSPNSTMSLADYQLTHAQVLSRSSFCRNVLSICYALERADLTTVEHQCDVFSASFGPEGWRTRYHIYSPGMKSGGGPQHKPTLSKNGCYLVRLFYFGAWRSIWVNDQVPVDATGSPLLPFAPITTLSAPPAKGPKQPATMIINDVLLWPLLMCKALLKLAAPDMNDDEDDDESEDEPIDYFDIVYALTGGLVVQYPLNPRKALLTPDEMWSLFLSDIREFSYDDEDDAKGKAVKKKDTSAKSVNDGSNRKGCMAMILLKDTKDAPVYLLPGITPAHEMYILVDTVRDVPLEKPLPEPEVPQWKTYRWVDWAKRHGLYEAYEFPRTKFIKTAGLMKLSYAPHLLDVQSTESNPKKGKDQKEADKTQSGKKEKEIDKHFTLSMAELAMMREQLRDWAAYNVAFPYISSINVAYFPSQYEFVSCGDAPPNRPTPVKMPNTPRQTDVQAPKQAPLYLQVDSADEIRLRLSLESIHPRVLLNCGMPILDYVEMSYVFLEEFKLFEGCDFPFCKGFIETRGYQGIVIILPPGRHFFRLWVHAAVHWYSMLASEASLVIGTRDTIFAAAVKECPWIQKYLMNINQTFLAWAKTDRATMNVKLFDIDFYSSYKPDLEWNEEKIGYKINQLHWMFRQALQALLKKRLFDNDFRNVCMVFRKYLLDPYFGIPRIKHTRLDLHGLVEFDPCDCPEPEIIEIEPSEVTVATEEIIPTEERPRIRNSLLLKLLEKPAEPYSSVLCDLASPDTSCGVLKAERNKHILRYDAAIVIQAYWRGFWARKCLLRSQNKNFTPDVLKLALDAAFGNIDSLTALMNEFFTLYPGTKDAYTIGHALGGIYSYNQHSNVATVTPKCKWVPFFQEVFFCHAPVKVHFDIISTLTNNTYAVFNNDDGQQLPQTFNSHMTFHIEPNNTGYTVIGHGTLHKPINAYVDIHWQLSVLTNTINTFHVCDKLSKDTDNPDSTQPSSFVDHLNICKELPVTPAVKITMEEIYVPNRRKILGGMHITCFQHDSICFRAEATNPNLEMEATLRTVDSYGLVEEIAKCSGVGELYWPFLRLEPQPPLSMQSRKSLSQVMLSKDPSARAKPKPPKPSSAKAKSSTKFKDLGMKLLEPKTYVIEVTTPTGWALTVEQWERVDTLRNDIFEFPKGELSAKSTKSAGSDRAKSAKEQAKKEPDPLPAVNHHDPEPDDAYIEMECSITANGALGVKRDDERAIAFINATMGWEALQPRRNARGELIREQFRDENLVPPPPTDNLTEGSEPEIELKEEELHPEWTLPNPTPVTESDRVSEEAPEVATYFTMPDILRDKFIPLQFVEECTKERTDEDPIYVTPEMAEAAKNERHDRIEAALVRMEELGTYNEIYILRRQNKRIRLLERLLIDCQHNTDILESFDERDNSVAAEVLARVASANKKKAQQAAASKAAAVSAKGKK